MNIIELIGKRIGELDKSLIALQNNANAHLGAIQELRRLLKEIEDGDGVQTSEQVRLDTKPLPANLD